MRWSYGQEEKLLMKETKDGLQVCRSTQDPKKINIETKFDHIKAKQRQMPLFK